MWLMGRFPLYRIDFIPAFCVSCLYSLLMPLDGVLVPERHILFLAFFVARGLCAAGTPAAGICFFTNLSVFCL